jgi:hypothetical protein
MEIVIEKKLVLLTITAATGQNKPLAPKIDRGTSCTLIAALAERSVLTPGLIADSIKRL